MQSGGPIQNARAMFLPTQAEAIDRARELGHGKAPYSGLVFEQEHQFVV